MTFVTRPTRADWVSASIVGAAAGTVFLGIGSRFAMRGIAVLSGDAPAWTFGGTLTVVFLGALSGVVAAQVWLGLRTVMPAARLLRGMVFWAFLVAISLRGLRPVDQTRLLRFMPLLVVFGATFQFVACRVLKLRARPDESGGARGGRSGSVLHRLRRAYSYLNARIGSTRDARRAGTYAAPNATSESNTTDDAITSGSVPLIS